MSKIKNSTVKLKRSNQRDGDKKLFADVKHIRWLVRRDMLLQHPKHLSEAAKESLMHYRDVIEKTLFALETELDTVCQDYV